MNKCVCTSTHLHHLHCLFDCPSPPGLFYLCGIHFVRTTTSDFTSTSPLLAACEFNVYALIGGLLVLGLLSFCLKVCLQGLNILVRIGHIFDGQNDGANPCRTVQPSTSTLTISGLHTGGPHDVHNQHANSCHTQLYTVRLFGELEVP